ncbi:DNA-binding domain-containing protein [Reichenbachiella versicolor]|uniref:DNA-binding domain-containing protein n=1 Tax=Reichenbachiella versicolor TaxID=1821036 RepID=UPI000D6DF3F8|nr:DNA-binding domain-containing protein [Reichenbachiella versicolor]
MPIKYALFQNHLTSDPDDYMAVVQDQDSKSKEEIIDDMISRGSTVTRAEALSVLEEFEASVERSLEDGFSINTPLFKISPSIQGVFYESDNFDRSQHYVRLNVTPGNRIGEIAGGIDVKKVNAVSPQPTLVSFKDVISGTSNETLTSGGVGEINGSLLKIDPSDAEQGVFMIATNGTATKADTIVRNKPSNVIFMIPGSLTAGEYRLEVRARLKGRKELKIGALSSPLQVL